MLTPFDCGSIATAPMMLFSPSERPVSAAKIREILRLAVPGEVARGHVEHVLGLGHADGDEGEARTTAVSLSENHEVLAVDQHAFGSPVTVNVGDEVEARLAAAGAALLPVERVHPVQ
jgi:hypothetical protein